MQNSALFELLNERGIVLFDSALGTALIDLGLPAGTRSEVVNAQDPAAIKKIHKANVDAGSDIITSNTFGISPLLAETVKNGKFDDGLALLRAGMECARDVADSSEYRILVALGLGPTGCIVELSDDLTHEEAIRIFAAQVKEGVNAGADLVLIETMSDLEELKDAVMAATASCDLPVICSMTFEENGRSFMGAEPVAFVQAAEALGAAAVGINCTLAPADILSVVNLIAGATSLPVLAQPNAGRPIVRDGKQVFEIDPAVFAADAAVLADVGASMLGGCCGTTPAEIALLNNILIANGKRKERKAL